MNAIRVMVVDHHRLVQECLCARLNREPTVQVVATATSGPEAVRLLRGSDRPHVALIAAQLPGFSGAEMVRRLRETRPQTRVVGLSPVEDAALLRDLAQAGAFAWLATTAPFADLLQILHEARYGRQARHPSLESVLLGARTGFATSFPKDPPLTHRELEILQHLHLGGSNRQIGYSLGISGRTVQSHLSSIYAKLAVRCRTEAALEGLRRGLVQP